MGSDLNFLRDFISICETEKKVKIVFIEGKVLPWHLVFILSSLHSRLISVIFRPLE